MADLKAFAEQLVNLTVKEVSELAEILKEEYGIEPAAAAAPVMVAGGAGEGAGEEGAVEDRTSVQGLCIRVVVVCCCCTCSPSSCCCC